MSDGADDFFKPGARPIRRKTTTGSEDTESRRAIQSPPSPESQLEQNAPSPEITPEPDESIGQQPSTERTETQPSPTSSTAPLLSPDSTNARRRRDPSAALNKFYSETPTTSKINRQDAPRSPNLGGQSPVELDQARTSPQSPADAPPRLFNPDFEQFLPPDLWRRLNGPHPQRRTLITAQERMRSILYQLSTFLPANLVQEKMLHPVPALVTGKILRGSLLFSDVSGFTALSERLSAFGVAGAERLTLLMNRYFATMLEIIAASGGILLKFAGDATLVYFPQAERKVDQRTSIHCGMAVRTGLRMLAAIEAFTDGGTTGEPVNLKMKIGIASGEFLASSIGSFNRMEYVVIGPAVESVMGAEAATTAAGQLIADAGTVSGLDSNFVCTAHKTGYYQVKLTEIEKLDEFEIQAGFQRSRSGINWSADHAEILKNMATVLQQIQAVLPYIPPEISQRVISQHAQRRVEGEFRPVVTIFCNFFGPELLLKAWGVSGVARLTAILSAYFNAMIQAIRRFGGVVTRIDPYSKGSKMLILFGAPIAHEDDPARAVNTALSMNMALEQVNERLIAKFRRFLPPEEKGSLIHHRIGITYGNIFATEVGSATRREYTVMGDDVNLAARLMSAGQPAQILVSPAMFEAIRHEYLITALNPIRVKGKSKPIPIYQVDGPSENILVNRLQKIRPLFGREAELSQARTSLAAAAAGKGGILVIEGPAGIGKSHFSDILLSEARESGIRLFATQCRSYTQETPYVAWSIILRSAAGITNIDPPQLAFKKFERLVAALHSQPPQSPGQTRALLGALMGIPSPGGQAASNIAGFSDPNQKNQVERGKLDYLADLKGGVTSRRTSRLDFIDQLSSRQVSETGQAWEPIVRLLEGNPRERTYACIANILSVISTDHPLIVYFEDAHWMDEGSKDILLWLAETLMNLPVLIMLSARNIDPRLAEKTYRVSLSPLRHADTTRLVADILVSEIGGLIYNQTGGNPLLVAEITRWIQRTRRISATDIEEILRTSDVLQKIILSRVEILPEAPRQVVRTAAVIGMGFRISVLQAALANAVDPVSLSAHLRTLVDAGLLTALEAGVDARYVFQQELVRNVLYNSLSFERRRELHGRIADSLATPSAARRQLSNRIAAFLDAPDVRKEERHEALVAYHQERAEHFSLAAQTYLKTAEMARKRNDWKDARDYYEHALAALQQSTPSAEQLASDQNIRFHALLGNADMLIALDQKPSDAIVILEKADTNREHTKNSQGQAALYLRLALLLPMQNKTIEASALLDLIEANIAVDLRPLATTLRAWLAFRARGEINAQAVQTTLQTLSDPSEIRIVLDELSGNWPAARNGYLRLGMPQAAALVNIRQGDACLTNDEIPAASQWYLQAACLWRRHGRNHAGLALAAYRYAEAAYRVENMAAARRSLGYASYHLRHAPTSIQTEGRALIRKAHYLLDVHASQPWPAWHWYHLEDQLKIALLYPRLIGLGL
jgi:class 3 adenylate cyclase